MNTEKKGSQVMKAGKYYVSSTENCFPTVFYDFDKKTYSDFSTGRSGKIRENEEISEEYSEEQIRLIKLNESALKFFNSNIQNAADYLKERKLTNQDVNNFHLGSTGKGLYKHLKKQGFSRKEMLDAGLFKEKDGRLQDTFWNRLIFPINDKNGHTIAFGGRTLTDSICKYINTSETAVFQKRKNLYMYDVAHSAPCKAYILCEGYMDVLTMHKYGFINTVASLGTSLTEEQVILLKNKPKVYIMYDSDAAGIKAAKRAVTMLKENVKVVNLSPAKDPDEFLLSYGKEKMIERMKEAVNGTEFLIKHFDENDSTDTLNFILNTA